MPGLAYSQPSTHSCFNILSETDVFPEPFGLATISSFGFSTVYVTVKPHPASAVEQIPFRCFQALVCLPFPYNAQTSYPTSCIMTRNCASVGSLSHKKLYVVSTFVSIGFLLKTAYQYVCSNHYLISQAGTHCTLRKPCQPVSITIAGLSNSDFARIYEVLTGSTNSFALRGLQSAC